MDGTHREDAMRRKLLSRVALALALIIPACALAQELASGAGGDRRCGGGGDGGRHWPRLDPLQRGRRRRRGSGADGDHRHDQVGDEKGLGPAGSTLNVAHATRTNTIGDPEFSAVLDGP